MKTTASPFWRLRLHLFATTVMVVLASLFSVQPSRAAISYLLDVDFGGAASDNTKTGFAAVGQNANDFWNFYNRTDTNGNWQNDGALSNLKLADATATSVGLIVSNAPGAWLNGSTDPMYNTYIYPFGGIATVTVTNLPSGQYDLYVYSQDGNYQVSVDGVSAGTKTTLDEPLNNPPVWQEGRQYARFDNLSVTNGQVLTLTVQSGIHGYAIIAGLQIANANSSSNNPPLIVSQPASQTVFAGANVSFSVGAIGSAPLSYQWSRNGVALDGATGSMLTLNSVQVAQAGNYSVLVSNSAGTTNSSDAVLTVVESNTNNYLLDVDFGGSSSDNTKTGFAAIGQTSSDFWNFYNRTDSSGNWQNNGALTNLKLVDGTITPIGLVVNNAPGAWLNGSTDPMYNTYIYPFGGVATVTLTNLPSGQYDLYIYSQDGNYQVSVGGLSAGTKTTRDVPLSNPPVWQEGKQYARFANLSVFSGQPVTVTVQPGVDGWAIIAGLQIARSGDVSSNQVPVIVSQPGSQSVFVGSDVSFSVSAVGTDPLSYQWSRNGAALDGATASVLNLANVQLDQAGQYSVQVSNFVGVATSSNATLTVVEPLTNATYLLDVDFGGATSDNTKTGFAEIGRNTNDFWNFYNRSDSNGNWQVNGTLTNLKLVDGSLTAVGLVVSNAPGAWLNGSSDPMYNTYIYPFAGVATVTLTNLPTGQYDLFVYSQDGNYDVSIGGVSAGTRTTLDEPLNNPPVWQEGRQYARFANLSIINGQSLTLTVQPGVHGYAIISGLQIAGTGGGSTNIAPVIVSQPASQTVFAGSDVTFSVSALGSQPLSYQWTRNGTAIDGATGSVLGLTSVQVAQAGNYSVQVSNSIGTATSLDAILTVVEPTTNTTYLLDVDFGGAPSDTQKTGFAAVGQNANDYWNFYSRNDSNGTWRANAALTNLKLVDGTITPVGLAVNNAPGAWANGSSDPMYNTYIYPFSGVATVTVTNLPTGQYDLYVYSSDGNYQVSVGGVSAGTKTTRDVPLNNPPVWQEGRQYARFGNLSVINGQTLTVTVLPGADGYAIISGLQIAGSGGGTSNSAPIIVSQPVSQSVFAGANVTFSVNAVGAEPLNYQWRWNGTSLVGATDSVLSLANVQVAQAGHYSVVVSNVAGVAISSDAALAVVESTTNYLLNVNFGSHLTPGLDAQKTGLAAVGQSANDFWNFYSRDAISTGGTNYQRWRDNGALSNLKLADGATTTAGLVVSNAPGCWANGSSDPMYNSYIYPFSGVATLTLTNLPAGPYELFVYSQDGNYQLTVGTNDVGTAVTRDEPLMDPPVWQEGRQYAHFTNIVVASDDSLTVTVNPGVDGYAIISGLQLLYVSPPAPATTPQVAHAGRLSTGSGSGNAMRVQFIATPAQLYRVQASTDLKNWLDIGTSLADDKGVCEFVDRDSPKFSARFYRLVAQ